MCGIAGAIDLHGQREFPRDRLALMCAALTHRGPDGEFHHFEPGLAMGVRRLALVDIGGGTQPLSNEDGTVWVAFNGELFDHARQRQQLMGRNHRMTSRCDTEVWPHWYEEDGDDIFALARGQFAVAIWDRKQQQLSLARDRTGICPLYYAEADGWLLWASEIKAILASGLLAPQPDVRAIDHLFCFGVAPSSRTFFDGIRHVAPGHFLQVCSGRVQTRRYWDFDFPPADDRPAPTPTEQLADELEYRLRSAVRRRLRGDVPVGCYVSGGVDSTLVLALACQENGGPVPSFTIGLEGSRRDERHQAAETANRLHSPLTVLPVDRDAIANLYPELMIATENPVVDTSCACMLSLAAEVHRQQIKVVLTGEGADEALGGYPWNHLLKLRSIPGLDSHHIARLLGGRRLMQHDRGRLERMPPFVGANVRPVQFDFIEVVARGREFLYSDQMWQQLEGHGPLDDCNLQTGRMADWHPLHQAAYMDYRVFLPGLLLSSKGDRSAMHSSVETRPPFLDEDVLDFCMRLHPSLKMRRFTEKWLLRRVAERILPRHIAYRPKQGFRTSFAATFLSPDRPTWVDQLLSRESLTATGFFDARQVDRYRKRHIRRLRWKIPDMTCDLALTAVIATQLWYHMFFGGLCDLDSATPATVGAVDLVATR